MEPESEIPAMRLQEKRSMLGFWQSIVCFGFLVGYFIHVAYFKVTVSKQQELNSYFKQKIKALEAEVNYLKYLTALDAYSKTRLKNDTIKALQNALKGMVLLLPIT